MGRTNLNSAFTNKKLKYSIPAFTNKVKELHNLEEVQVIPFIMGARGIWCSKNKDLSELLELTYLQKTVITADTIKGSIDIYKDFGTRVWNGGSNQRSRRRLHNNNNN